jgi:hypothetical protein
VGNIASGAASTVGGGVSNTVSGSHATVPGGATNVATGVGSFCAGVNATDVKSGTTCNHSFVWGDGTRPSLSQGSNTFNILATGGVYCYTYASNEQPYGAYLAANSTSWNSICDRNAKKNFQPVDTMAVLEKLAAIPIQRWN